MSDLIEAGSERPRRRRPAILAVAVLLAVAALQVPGLLEARDERREQDRRAAAVALTGGHPEGSGSRADGTALLAYRLTNAGPLPVRLVLLRLRGGALTGEQQFGASVEPLLSGASRSFDVTVTSARCPDAVSTAPNTRLEAVVATADGEQRTVTVHRDEQWRRFESLVDTARLVCDRPRPASAADPLLLELRVTGDVARAVLVLSPPEHPVSLVRLVATDGLAWSTPLQLPLRVEAGQEVRVPVVARRGDCRLLTAGSGPGSLGFELTVESAPGDSYVEPPEVTSTTPGDLSVAGDRLGALRDRLCGFTRT